MAVDLETVEKLIQFMERHGLTELHVHEGDLEFRARRGERRDLPFVFQPAHGIVNPAVAPAGPVASQPAAGAPPQAQPAAPARPLKEISSPLVGTFYRCPSPGASPYKEVGDRVEKEDVVCIVEAMKVMNEIRADVNGVIRKILAEDSTPVEFGQPLFLVEPQ